MATPMTVQNPPPTGVVATYFGAAGGATAYYYWIEAIYPSGRSLLTSSNLVTAVAAFSAGVNEVLVSWSAMAGAIGYNVYRTATTTAPTVGTNFMASVTANAFTDNGVPAIATGQVIVDGLRLARARYSFAVDAGVVGLITLAQSDVIPKGAIMVGGTLNSTTALVGSSSTIAVGTSAGSSASALKAATAEATYTTNAVLNVVPVFATPVKMTADGTITITVAVANLTAGIMDIMILYYMPLS